MSLRVGSGGLQSEGTGEGLKTTPTTIRGPIPRHTIERYLSGFSPLKRRFGSVCGVTFGTDSTGSHKGFRFVCNIYLLYEIKKWSALSVTFCPSETHAPTPSEDPGHDEGPNEASGGLKEVVGGLQHFYNEQ